MRAVVDGIRRVNRAPAVLAGAWLLTAAVSLPLTLALRGMLIDHLGQSLAADTAASGVNYDWMQEFADQAAGVGATFRPTIVGFAAVLDNLSAFIDAAARPIVIVGAASAYIVLWLFLAGGAIDRLARDRPTRGAGFFAAAGVFFFRFVRLGVLQGIVYALLFRTVHPWLFGRLYERMTHEMTAERDALAVRAGLYLVFGAAVAACSLIFDYAKVRTVVEDRRSMLGAIAAALRFVRRHATAAAGVFLIDVALFAVVIGSYAAVAPGVGPAGWRMWAAFAVGEIYVAARLWVKLVFWASETSLFQSRLAHAGYVARPAARWPESASVEAIQAASA